MLAALSGCSFVFWTLLYAAPAVWCALGFIAILKLNIDYLLLVVIAVLLRCGEGCRCVLQVMLCAIRY